MAKNLTEEEVAAAEEQAQLKERMKAAQKSMAPLTASQIRENERQRQIEQNNANAEARGRRMDEMAQIAIGDRGRYSSFARKDAMEWMKEREGKRRFDVENQRKLQESADKREGMIHAGEGAAEKKADADKAIAEARYGKWDIEDGNYVFRQGGEAEVEQIKKDAAEYLSRAEHGYTDEKGVYHPGSAERVQESKNRGMVDVARQQGADNLTVSKQQGADNLAIEQERSKSAQAQMQIKALTDTARSDEKIELLRLKSKSKLNEIQFKGLVTQISKELMGDPMTGRKAMTPDELKKKYKDNPDVLNILNSDMSTGSGGTSSYEVK